MAAAICASSAAAYGTGVQVNLSSNFNGDDVLRYNGAFTTPGSTYDSSANAGSDSYLVTQSAANQLAGAGGGGVGLNDTGFYPATGSQPYDVQLGLTNSTPTGVNTVVRETAANSSFNIGVPPNKYAQFAIFGSGGSGSSTLTITLTYSTGSPTVLMGVTLPDWYSGNPGTTGLGAAGTYFALTPAMSRDHQSTGYQAPAAGGGAYVYGINLAPDPTRVLTGVTVLVTSLSSPGSTVANFLAAAGALASSNPSATPVPSTLLLGLLGLTLIGWFSLRERRKAF